MELFKAKGETFLQILLTELQSLGFPVEKMTADHLCFRVETDSEYQSYKKFLSAHAELLTEAPVNGRPIATYKLSEPFRSPYGTVPLVELPAPKENSPYKTGFEHAEFVIEESFEVIQKRYPHLQFKISGSKINPELCMKTKSGQVKFHHQSLEQVIALEKAQLL